MGDIFRNTEFVNWLGEQRPFYGNFVAATQIGPPPPTPTPSVTAQVTPTPTVTPTNTTTPTVTPTNTVTPTKTSTPTPTPTLPAGTTEAYAYLASVVAAGGTVSSTASGATITFFQALFSNGLYTRLNAFWPFIGGTAASHAVEGKLAFTMAWQGGMTHGISGATGNGTNGYGNTGYNPNVRIGNTNPSSMGVYVTVQGSTGNRIYDAGVNNATLADQLNIASRRVTGPTDAILFDAGTYDPGADGRVSTTTATALGLTIGSALSDTSRKLYRNGSLIASQINSRTLTYANRNMYFAAQNEGGTANWYNSNTWGFFFIGTGLSDGEVSTLSTLINNYQTSLSRNAY